MENIEEFRRKIAELEDKIRLNETLKRRILDLEEENNKLKTHITAFNEYDVVNEQIQRTVMPRIQWNKTLKQSLTKSCAEAYAKGQTAQECYGELAQKIIDTGITDTNILREILRKLKIGVSSRFSEMHSEMKKIRETREKINRL